MRTRRRRLSLSPRPDFRNCVSAKSRSMIRVRIVSECLRGETGFASDCRDLLGAWEERRTLISSHRPGPRRWQKKNITNQIPREEWGHISVVSGAGAARPRPEQPRSNKVSLARFPQGTKQGTHPHTKGVWVVALVGQDLDSTARTPRLEPPVPGKKKKVQRETMTSNE